MAEDNRELAERLRVGKLPDSELYDEGSGLILD